MLPLSSIILAGFIAGMIFYLSRKEEHTGNLPLGPKGLRFIGSILSLSMRPHKRFCEWAKMYGPVFTMKLGSYRFVILSDAKVIKEAFNNPYLNGRPDFPLLQIFSGPNHGISATSGTVWTDQRQFTLITLRTMGFGKRVLQELALDDVRQFVRWLKSQEGKSISLNRKFVIAAINSLWSITASKSFAQHDSQLVQFLNATDKIFEGLMKNPIVMFYPHLARAFPRLSGWDKLMSNVRQFRSFIGDHVAERKNNYSDKNEPRDFVEAYLQEINKTSDPQSSFYKSDGEENLQAILIDLFVAGSETTALTLTWAILYCTKFKHVQEKLHTELDSVVGRTRTPTLEDRRNMPYMEAFILETLRKSSFSPFGIFHSATETTTLKGYTIPKGSWVGANQYCVHHDPKIWTDPEAIRPERFLSADRTTVIKNDGLIPFSVGKRSCIGEQFAKDNVFMFLAGILHRFEINFDPDLPEPSLESDTLFFLRPPQYYVRMTDRLV